MLKNHLKLAFRHFLRQPGISGLNLLGFALGIACAFIGMLFAWEAYSYDRHFADHERVYRIGVDFMGMGGFASAPEVLSSHLQANSPAVERATHIKYRGEVLLTDSLRSLQADLVVADSQFFEVFDYEFTAGQRASALREPYEAVLAESLAKAWFGTGNSLGQFIHIQDHEQPYRVVGLVKDLAQKSHLRGNLWTSNHHLLSHEANWFSATFHTYVKLKAGSHRADLQASLNKIIEQKIFPEYGGAGVSYEDWKQQEKAFRFFVHPIADIYLHSKLNFDISVGGDETKVLGFLFIGLAILCIALANYINLSTARYQVRAKEIAIKKAVGADRRHLIRQFMWESLVFGLIAALLALVLAELVLISFEYIRGIPLFTIPLFHPLSIGVFVGFSLIASLTAGAYPALWLSKFRPVQMIRGQKEPGRNRFTRSALVVFQFSIALSLMIGSLVLYQQLQYMRHKDLGFDQANLLLVENLEAMGEADRTYQQILAQHPVVQVSSMVSGVPGSHTMYQRDYQTTQMQQSLPLRTCSVDEGFIPTYGMTLLAGRNFRPNAPADSGAVILNESAVKALGLSDPLQAKVREGLHVIGVVSDFHIEGLREGIKPLVLGYTQNGSELALRLRADLAGEEIQDFLQTAQDQWTQMAGETSFTYTFMEDHFAEYLEEDALQSKGILALTGLAIFIACLGLLALAAFSTERRSKEIGIRKVLGASAVQLVSLLTRQFLTLVLLALLIASPIAWWVMNDWLADFAYRIDIPWWTFLLAGAAAIAIAFLTISAHSLKAALANPVNTLRSE